METSGSTKDYTVALSTDAALRLLADRHRRELLRQLIAAEDEPVPVDALAAALAEADAPRARDQRAIATSLYHVHLPMLADRDLIEWDATTETVRYRPTDPVEDLLAFLSSRAE